MIKGIYLASFKANHPNHNLIYQDINGKRDISGDMLEVDIKDYDYIIATPPCNYWSRANYRREISEYALKTKHLLPEIIKKLIKNGKPFIVENVRNKKLMQENGLYDLNCYIYHVGRHTYWSNIILDIEKITFEPENIQNKSKTNRQGGTQVHEVVEIFIKTIKELKENDS